ncbi:MAG: phosphonoacetaldehyde hydrolase [Osedax symbiont Rs2]|nr:MAG: phosphonoacetaldehyde hydrolase [Osedax symbiont Rs2]
MDLIEAVIMDWAGTSVDFGSTAPIRGFLALFASRGITITEAEARGPMGCEKRRHIEQLLQLPRIKQAWLHRYGQHSTVDDLDELFEQFVPLQITAISESSTLIPGLLTLLEWAQKKGIKIAANTGYSESMVVELLQSAAEQGYRPQSNVCASQVTKGRPYPYMCMANAMQLGVMKLACCVKIDDTVPGIAEGLNAGMWTIAVSVSGNEVGLSLSEWQQLDLQTQKKLREKAELKLRNGGAHYVVDSIAEVIPCLNDIAFRLAQGERP